MGGRYRARFGPSPLLGGVGFTPQFAVLTRPRVGATAQSAPVLEGAGNTHTIVCPYHAWSYCSDGRFRHARFASEMRGFNPAEFCLPQIKAESICRLLFVNLKLGATAITDLAPGLDDDLRTHVPYLAHLRPVENFAFDSPQAAGWKANWKVVVDNYMECHHCAKARPALADLMVMDSCEHVVHDQWARQLSRRSRTENRACAFAAEDDVQVAAYWYLWPPPRSGWCRGPPTCSCSR